MKTIVLDCNVPRAEVDEVAVVLRTTRSPRLEPEHELRWKGRLVIPGLFDGEHAFVLTALENGRTRVDHWERFGGVLLPIARGMVYEATVQSFHALNAALAKRATMSAQRTADMSLVPPACA